MKTSNLTVELHGLVVVDLGHHLHLLSDQLLLVEQLCLHLCNLLILDDHLILLLFDRFLQKNDLLLELGDLPDMIGILLAALTFCYTFTSTV